MIEEYKQAFQRCYPHHSIRVKAVRVRNEPEPHYRVFINEEAGEKLLTGDDIRFATRMFNRGLRH